MNTQEELRLLEHPDIKSNIKDCIGFDLGHGDTSIHSVSATGSSIKKIAITKGVYVIPTIVGTRPDGTIVVGKNAMGNKILNCVQQFKSPNVKNLEVANSIRSFVCGVMDGIRTDISRIPFDETTLVVFGCPSAWSTEQRLAYGKLLAEQLPTMPVMLVSESRAAYITTKEEKGLGLDQDRDSVLIVDMGSSTTDFTFVLDLVPSELSIGKHYPLGASLIEKYLIEKALSTSDERKAIKDWWDKHPSEYYRTVFEIRREKEEFFNDEKSYSLNDPIPFQFKYWIKEGQALEFKVSVTNADFYEAVNAPINDLGNSPISWHERFRTDLKAASTAIVDAIGRTPQMVILTGGAARMDFAQNTVKEVFPEPIAVRLSDEPEYTISIGLALAGSIHYRTKNFTAEIDKMINEGKVEKIISNEMSFFANAIAKSVATNATERFILPEFMHWRESGQGKLKDITKRVADNIETWQESKKGRKEILNGLDQWYRKIEDELHAVTSPICKKYNLEEDSLDIPTDIFNSTRPNSPTDADEVMFATTRTILSVLIATVSFVISNLLFGAGIAVIGTGPLAVIIVGLGLWMWGEDVKDELIETVMDLEIPGWVRKMYPASWLKSTLQKRAEETDKKIYIEIVYSLLGGYPDDDPDKKDKEKRAEKNRTKIINDITIGISDTLKRRAEEISILIS